MGSDPKSTAKAILGMAAPASGDAERADVPEDGFEVDSEDAALNAAADEAFDAVKNNDPAAFRAAFKSAFKAFSGV